MAGIYGQGHLDPGPPARPVHVLPFSNPTPLGNPEGRSTAPSDPFSGWVFAFCSLLVVLSGTIPIKRGDTMTKKAKLAIEMSEKRQKLNELLGKDEL